MNQKILYSRQTNVSLFIIQSQCQYMYCSNTRYTHFDLLWVTTVRLLDSQLNYSHDDEGQLEYKMNIGIPDWSLYLYYCWVIAHCHKEEAIFCLMLCSKWIIIMYPIFPSGSHKSFVAVSIIAPPLRSRCLYQHQPNYNRQKLNMLQRSGQSQELTPLRESGVTGLKGDLTV